ncbi:MAG: hypothetical protein HYU88_09320 [Chloroflexi bacterium]|nr:hypothetical protein [Chloroflexota bacterium]MBI4503932.1 hypothetical protein [Chloroflexota bacterium]
MADPHVRWIVHFEQRLAERKIRWELARRVYVGADLHVRDAVTGRFIAVKRVVHLGKERDLAIVYIEDKDDVLLITVLVLKRGQLQRRLASGRWLRR